MKIILLWPGARVCVYVVSIQWNYKDPIFTYVFNTESKAGLKFVFLLSQHSMFRDYNHVPKLLATRHFYMSFSSVLWAWHQTCPIKSLSFFFVSPQENTLSYATVVDWDLFFSDNVSLSINPPPSSQIPLIRTLLLLCNAVVLDHLCLSPFMWTANL